MRVVYQFMIPVCVEVKDGKVSSVIVIDETPVADPTYVEGARTYLAAAVEESLNGQDWPAWEFGY